MMEKDAFSRWLGIEVLSTEPGKCKLHMKVRKEMCNGFGVAHGGITYSLADSAMAFATNSHGRKAMSVDSNVAHLAKVMDGDELIAEAQEISRNHKIASCAVDIKNNKGDLVAQFRGTVYISSSEW